MTGSLLGVVSDGADPVDIGISKTCVAVDPVDMGIPKTCVAAEIKNQNDASAATGGAGPMNCVVMCP